MPLTISLLRKGKLCTFQVMVTFTVKIILSQLFIRMRPSVTRNGKPSNAYLATLKKVSVRDMEKLVEASISAIINEEVDVIILFGYTMKFPDDFPRGICMRKEDDGSNVHKVKAKRLLMWLHDKGYTAVTVEIVAVQKRLFAETEKVSKIFSVNSY